MFASPWSAPAWMKTNNAINGQVKNMIWNLNGQVKKKIWNLNEQVK